MELIDLCKARVRYRLVGDGPTLVLVPDPPNMIEHYAGLIAELSRDHRVLCFDVPGFGFSFPKRGFNYTLQEQADTLIGVLEALDLRNVTLSISCLGAFAGLLVAAHRPELIGRLVLSQVASYEQMRRWSYQKDMYRIIQTPLVGQVAVRFGKRQVANHWYHVALPVGSDPQRYVQPTLRAFAQGACFGLASAFQAVQRGTFRPEAPVHQPAVVLWGVSDRTHARTARPSILEHVPHAELIEHQGCGHFPDLEREAEYCGFVRGLTRSG